MWKARTQDLRLLFLPDDTRDHAATGAMESGSSSHHGPHDRTFREKDTRGRARNRPSPQAPESSHGRRNDHGPTTLGRLRGIGFLRNSVSVPGRVAKQICSASKRKREDPDGGTAEPKRKRQTCPVIPMVLLLDGKQHQVKTLLDTGCSIPLINQRTIERLGIERKTYKNPRTIESFTGETVENAGKYYTGPLRLRHRDHYTSERFSVAPMEEAIDLFLPFEWIERHPPQGAWTPEEIRFNSARCLEECTKFGTNPFSLTWDESVLHEKEAWLIGYVSTVEGNTDPIAEVPREF